MSLYGEKLLLGLICCFYFLLRGILNVFFVISQTVFLSTAGFTKLPYVYSFMNLIYISLQFYSVSRLTRNSATRIQQITWVFLSLFIFRLFLPQPESLGVVTFFLLLVMVFDLFFTQFFLHFLQEIFPLQQGKALLPLIMGFGSLSFIVSGFLMKISLAVLSFRDLIGIGAALIAGCQVIFFYAKKMAHPISASAPLSPEEDLDNKPVLNDAIPSIGLWIISFTFLQMIGKYWLDYQYSKVITKEFTNPTQLASFIAVYSSITDFIVLFTQIFFAGKILKFFRLTTIIKFLPATISVFCFFSAIFGGFWAILLSQFLFTFLGKSLHNSTVSLLMGVIPSTKRLKTMGYLGIFAAGGALFSGFSLILFQEVLSLTTAFFALSAIFLLMLFLCGSLENAYLKELEGLLDASGAEPPSEIVDLILHVKDYSKKLYYLRRILEPPSEVKTNRVSEVVVRKAILLTRALQPSDARDLLLPLIKEEKSPKIRSMAAKTLVATAGEDEVQYLLELAFDPLLDERTRADIVEALGELDLSEAQQEKLRFFLSAQHHRLKANTASTLIKVCNEPESIEMALKCLWEMFSDSRNSANRSASIVAMKRIGHENFISDFILALHDPFPGVQIQAVSALGMFPLPAVAETLHTFLESSPTAEVAKQAKEELKRVTALTSSEISQIFDSLSESERALLTERLSKIENDTTLQIVQKAFKIPSQSLRIAFTSFIQKVQVHEDLGSFERCLIQAETGITFDVGSFAHLIRSAKGPKLEILVEFMQCVIHAENGELYDTVLFSLLQQTWLIGAVKERLMKESGFEKQKVEIEKAFEANEQSIFRLAAARCGSPRLLLEAVSKTRMEDPFEASYGFEYLETSLPASFSKIFLSFLGSRKEQNRLINHALEMTGLQLGEMPIDQLLELVPMKPDPSSNGESK